MPRQRPMIALRTALMALVQHPMSAFPAGFLLPGGTERLRLPPTGAPSWGGFVAPSRATRDKRRPPRRRRARRSIRQRVRGKA